MNPHNTSEVVSVWKVAKPIRKGALMRLFQNPVFNTGVWTCKTEQDPIQLGEYGRREWYAWEGVPVFRLDIRFNPPETKAFVTNNIKELLHQ